MAPPVAPESSRITQALERASPAKFSAYAILAAFTTYFCMYAFRKPFGAGTFCIDGGLECSSDETYKITFVVAQLLGYCASKFIGIKVISEMSPAKRALSLFGFIGIAEAALLLFAVTPAPYNAVWMFVNGLPLGMIWGLVFGFLEGRKVSEALGAGLSASYIVASGVVKSVGRWFIDAGVPEYWMPFVTGLAFAPLFVIAVLALKQLPPPNAEDEAARVKREPMDAKRRNAFVLTYLGGLLPLILLYFFLTAYRDFRDNFAVELWNALGYGGKPAVLATSEMYVAAGVMLVLGLLMLIRGNRKALVVVHLVMAGGTALVGLSTLAWQYEMIEPFTWMILVGLGLYMAYVPYGCVLFDRMLAALGVLGTAGFMIYVTDAFGYLGSICINLYKNYGAADLSWLDFFVKFSYLTCFLCTTCFLVSMVYFARKSKLRDMRSDAE